MTRANRGRRPGPRAAARVIRLGSGLAFGIVLAMGPGLAQESGWQDIRVRSGEHPGFSRLVIEPPARTDWRFGRVEGGYALDLGRADAGYDLSRVFGPITRARIADLRQDPQTGRLTLLLGCACHATVTVHRGNWLIIDVAPGPAAGTSPFEAALPAATLVRAPVPAPQNRAVVSPAPAPAAIAPPGPPPVPLPSSAPLPAGSATAVPLLPGQSGGMVALADGTGWRPDPWAGVWRDSFGMLPLGGAEVPPVGQDQGTAPSATPAAPHTARDRPAPSAAERVADQEALLLEELARAASQGLLEANLPALDRALGRDVPAPAPEPAEAPPEPAPQDHVRMEAESSIDRDTRAYRSGRTATSDGVACLPDALFDLAAWGGDSTPAEGISDRRKALVGEFDRPDSGAVMELARYYLYLGFGAEARAVIRAFLPESPDAQVLSDLAVVLDGTDDGLPGGLPGRLAGQASCGGRVALWSTLAEGGPHRGDTPNTSALIAAFDELPLHLRRQLGPSLIARFLAAGDEETALVLRNAIARAPGDHGAALDLAEMRLAHAQGADFDPGRVEALIAADDALAPEAYAAFLEAELAQGRVPPEAPETAAAMAFEIAETPQGAALNDLALRAILAGGDFDLAREELMRLERDRRAPDPGGWRTLADAITRGAGDGTFLRLVFASRGDLAQALPGHAEATPLARRLTGLGFPDEALAYLPAQDATQGPSEAGPQSPEDAETDRRMARAEALIAAGAPGQAFAALDDLATPGSDRLRAQALVAMGDPAGAAARFEQAGEVDLARRTAWVAGAWELLAETDDPLLREIATRQLARAGENPGTGPSDQTAEVDAAGQPAGRVDAARAALEEAEAARRILQSLLDGAPVSGSR